MRNVWCFILFTSIQSMFAQAFHEGFENVEAMINSGGWARQNLSNSLGTFPNWGQGNILYSAHSGSSNSYATVGMSCVSGIDNISNWLFTPNVQYENGDTLRFYTRCVTSGVPDRMQVRLSNAGSSVNAGSNNASVGDFTILLTEINPQVASGVYPDSWTMYEIVLTGLSQPGNGRFAFWYNVSNGGPGGWNSYAILLDDVEFIPGCFQGPGINLDNVQSPSCHDGNDGEISISTMGGVAPLNISWSNGSGALDLVQLTSGDYTVTVEDAVGCSVHETISLLNPEPIVITAGVVQSPMCFDSNDGSISITHTGGLEPLVVTWDNGSTSTDLVGLAEGNYTVTVVDALGCSVSETILLGSPEDLLVASSTTPSQNGSDGTASVAVVGGTPPYTYVWSPSGGSASSATGLAPGTYIVTVTDANGCQEITAVVVEDVSGVMENTLESIQLMPNPSSEQVTLSTSDKNLQIERVLVYSMEGKKMHVPEFSLGNKPTFSISSWKPGLYLVHVWMKGHEYTLHPLVKH